MKFNVSYQQTTPESADNGEFSKQGYICENVSLADAIEALGESNYCKTSIYPIDLNQPFDITAYEVNDGTRDFYEKGISENRVLHMPENITPLSRKRILCLLNIDI